MKIERAVLKRALRCALLAFIVCTLVFIFVNSMIPTEKSAEISGGVGGFLAGIISPDTPLGAFLQRYIRKIAHFTEYGFLGAEIALYIFFFCKEKRKYASNSAFLPFLVGFIDESVQLISKRGASVLDVWIDAFGFIFFSLIAYALLFGVRFIIYSVKK